jgi:hypothetical protein
MLRDLEKSEALVKLQISSTVATATKITTSNELHTRDRLFVVQEQC